jgi:hypothetical protein
MTNDDDGRKSTVGDFASRIALNLEISRSASVTENHVSRHVR